MSKTCIIIGASHAGGQAAISLRQNGWTGSIVLIGEEAYPPYHRPPLSKEFLSGGKNIDEILIRPTATYDTANVDILTGHKVREIDRDDKLVFLNDASTLQYDKLVLATGASPRPLPIDGADLANVFYLRNADDVLKIKSAAKTAKKAVIIGGGYIGLEAASSLTRQGLKVTVLEMENRILQRVTAPVMSTFYKHIHRQEGVEIIENCAATHIKNVGNDLKITTTKNSLTADMVIVGIGIIPNTKLAKNCKLEVGDGIIVNEYCQTTDPDIYAIGDVSWHYNPIYKTYLRLESVPNATEQAKTAAQAICQNPKPYNTLPWFWSDQFDLKLQIAGLSKGYDNIILRGDPGKGRNFAAFYFKGDKLLAVDAVNRPQEFMLGKRLIPQNRAIDKKALADESVALKTLLKQPGGHR